MSNPSNLDLSLQDAKKALATIEILAGQAYRQMKEHERSIGDLVAQSTILNIRALAVSGREALDSAYFDKIHGQPEDVTTPNQAILAQIKATGKKPDKEFRQHMLRLNVKEDRKFEE